MSDRSNLDNLATGNIAFRTPERSVQTPPQEYALDDETLVLPRRRYEDAVNAADSLTSAYQGMLQAGTPLRPALQKQFQEEIDAHLLMVKEAEAELQAHTAILRISREAEANERILELERIAVAEAESYELASARQRHAMQVIVDRKIAEQMALQTTNDGLRAELAAANARLTNVALNSAEQFSFGTVPPSAVRDAVTPTPAYGPGSKGYNLSPPGTAVPDLAANSAQTSHPSGDRTTAGPSPPPDRFTPPARPGFSTGFGGGMTEPMSVDDFMRDYVLRTAGFSVPHLLSFAMGSTSTMFESTPQLCSSGLVFMGNDVMTQALLPRSPMLLPHFRNEMNTYLRLQSLANRQWMTWQEFHSGLDNREEQGMLAKYNKDMTKSLIPTKFDGTGGPRAAYAHWMAFAAYVRALNRFQRILIEQDWVALFSQTFVGEAIIWYSMLFGKNDGLVFSALALLSEYHNKFIGLPYLKLLNDKLSGNDTSWGPSSKTPVSMLKFLDDFVSLHAQHSILWVSKPTVLVAPTVAMLMSVLTRVFNNYDAELCIRLQAEMRREFPTIQASYVKIRMQDFMMDPEWWLTFAQTHFIRQLTLEPPKAPRVWPNASTKIHTGVQVFKNRRNSNSFGVLDESDSDSLDVSGGIGSSSYALSASRFTKAELTLNAMVFALCNVEDEGESQRGQIMSTLFTDDGESSRQVLAVLNTGTLHSFVGFDIGENNMICGLTAKDGSVYQFKCWNCGQLGHMAAQCPEKKEGDGFTHRPNQDKMRQGKGLGKMRQ